MGWIPWFMIATVVLLQFFDYAKGVHDTADMVGSVIATRAMSPMQAIAIVSYSQGFAFHPSVLLPPLGPGLRWLSLTARLPDQPADPLTPMPTDEAWLAPVLGAKAVLASEFAGDETEAVWLPNEVIA